MYFIPKANDRTQFTGLRGLAQPGDTSERQKSFSAILKALQLNPVGGYVKGSFARTKLEDALKSVPITSALEVFNQLKNGEGVLGRLFQYRLHDATKKIVLNILWLKHLEQQKQLKKAQEFVKNVCDEQKRGIERASAALQDFDKRVERVCKLDGEDSDACQKLRFKLLEAKTHHEDKVRSYRARCP